MHMAFVFRLKDSSSKSYNNNDDINNGNNIDSGEK